jgi:hypothetical protein
VSAASAQKKGIPPTIGNFFVVLSSKLTQYDMAECKREMKRGRSNIYRLGHLLKAAQDAEKLVYAKHDKDETMTPQAAKVFMNALVRNFIYEFGEFGLAPVRNVVRQLQAFLDHGQNPSLVGSGVVKGASKNETPSTKGEFAYVGSGAQVFIPDHKITSTATKLSYFAVPLRGQGHVMGVWDSHFDKFIGWLRAEDLGYADAKAWLAAAHADPRMLDPIRKFL